MEERLDYNTLREGIIYDDCISQGYGTDGRIYGNCSQGAKLYIQLLDLMNSGAPVELLEQIIQLISRSLFPDIATGTMIPISLKQTYRGAYYLSCSLGREKLKRHYKSILDTMGNGP